MEKTTEVLVIGSGVAGIRAAVVSAAFGTKVTVVSKNDIGNSTKSPVNARYSQNFDLMYKTGDYLGNTELVKILCSLAKSEIDYLKQKTEMIKTEFGYMPSSKSGKQIIDSIRFDAKNLSIEKINDFDLVDIMTKNGRCHGAVFKKNNDFMIVFSGATIIATGGYSNAIGISDNPKIVNGLGICASFRKGRAILNPEFVMSYPFGIESAKTIVAGILLEYPDIVDEHGEKFLSEDLEISVKENKYHHLLSQINIEFMNKISNGEKVFLDYSSVKHDKIRDIIKNEVYGGALRLLKNKKLSICPVYHYSLGGLVINKNAQTTIRNLYASGEIIGGIHGSLRLGGNGITESLVFGKIAGENAALNCDIKKVSVHVVPRKIRNVPRVCQICA